MGWGGHSWAGRAGDTARFRSPQLLRRRPANALPLVLKVCDQARSTQGRPLHREQGVWRLSGGRAGRALGLHGAPWAEIFLNVVPSPKQPRALPPALPRLDKSSRGTVESILAVFF